MSRKCRVTKDTTRGGVCKYYPEVRILGIWFRFPVPCGDDVYYYSEALAVAYIQLRQDKCIESKKLKDNNKVIKREVL